MMAMMMIVMLMMVKKGGDYGDNDYNVEGDFVFDENVDNYHSYNYEEKEEEEEEEEAAAGPTSFSQHFGEVCITQENTYAYFN